MPSRLDWHGERCEALIVEAAGRGLGDALGIVAESSQDKVPVQTGELKRSQFTDRDGLRGVVGYTDSKAAAAHENLTVNLRNGKEPKFLESAVNENRARIEAAVTDAIRSVL